MIFVLDNFDSFTYNIVQYLQQLGCEVVVRRNNAVTVDEGKGADPVTGDLPRASGDWSGVWRQGGRCEEDHARQDFGDHA